MESLNTAINRDSHIPYYVQVRDALQETIERGHWQPGDQLPGEPELCRLFGVSRPVIRQALQEMEYRGLIRRQKGKGTFVAEPKLVEGWMQTLTGFFQGMAARGITPVTRVLSQDVIPASAKVAGYLHLNQGDAVIAIERLRFIDDEPILLGKTFVPQAICPKLAEADLSRRSLYEFLETECGLVIVRGRRTFEAVLATGYEAGLLNVKPGAPLILLNNITYLEDGTPLEYFYSWHRSDRAQFEVELMRVRQQGSVSVVLADDASSPPPGN